jgi:hypothetical protein
LVDKIEKNEMGDACSMYVEKKIAYRILVGKPEGKNRLEDTGVEGRIIFRKWDGGVY